jgi:hypothetical protein
VDATLVSRQKNAPMRVSERDSWKPDFPASFHEGPPRFDTGMFVGTVGIDLR